MVLCSANNRLMKKISVIDVGSNSVRLAMMADGKTLYKKLATTRLGEGLSVTGKISAQAGERTANAVADLKNYALSQGAQKVYVFATAAVRSAVNRQEFLNLVRRVCGVEVDVLSGQDEARIGISGALKDRDGGIIDVGGASTEVTVQTGGKCVYSVSADVGAVRLFDVAGRDKIKLENVISDKITAYGNFQASAYSMYAIGGTATTLASVKHGLEVYDPEVVDGTVISVEEAGRMADRLLSLTVEGVRALKGMEPRRADVIGGGCLLLYSVMKKLGIEKITVSESDNLEGYYILKEGLNEEF